MSASQRTTLTAFRSLTSSRAIQVFAAVTILALVLAFLLGIHGLPFHRPAVATAEIGPNLFIQVVQILIALVIITVAFWITRGRATVDFDARTPERPIAKRETFGLLAYGAVVLVIGSLFGVGLHLHGAVFGPTQEVVPSEVYTWTAYNFLMFAVVPYLLFRRRGYGHRALCLKSNNIKSDTLLIVTVLLVESVVELVTFPDLFALTTSQLLIGMPVTLVFHLLGTGLPVMIFVYAILFPRYMTLTGSAPAAVVLGALTYAGLHIFEYWTAYDSLRHGVLSVVFVFLQFAFPGLIKSVLTLRTGNAWVHLWAYHVIAPHVTVDTPLIVRVFGIR